MNEMDEGNTANGAGRTKPPLTEQRKASIKNDYLNSDLTVNRIAVKHDTTSSAIYRLVKKENWPRRSALKRASSKKALPKKALAKPEIKVPSPAPDRDVDPQQACRHRDELIDHLRRCLERQIKEPSASADREKDARTLATLTRTLEKIEELDRQITPTESEADADASDTTKTVEDIRAELERRLNRIIAAK